jgi:hypothetical protein
LNDFAQFDAYPRLILAAGRRSWLTCDPLRSDGKTCACGMSGVTEQADLAGASHQIVGKVERHPGTPTPSAEAEE